MTVRLTDTFCIFMYVKVVLVHAMTASGVVEVHLHVFLTSALYGDDRSVSPHGRVVTSCITYLAVADF